MCQGCGNNSTKNRDKFGKSYCMRSKACKAEAQLYYAENGIEVEMSSAPPSVVREVPVKQKKVPSRPSREEEEEEEEAGTAASSVGKSGRRKRN